MPACELNLDGLVGPTHNYAGLSHGNLASMNNQSTTSNPRKAALEGLAKMKFMLDLGLKQAVLPPHERPHVPTLRRLGFTGKDAAIIEQARRTDPTLLASVSSASSMWAANAATVSPSADTRDGRVHFTPANLVCNFHRAIETQSTARVLHAVFNDESRFAHHDPLPATVGFSDEGAANHTRLCGAYHEPGIELFVFGRADGDKPAVPGKFPVRQTRQACEAIARLHQLNPARTLFIRQSPRSIDAGAFHNDVLAVGNRNVLLYHEHVWHDGEHDVEAIRRALPLLVTHRVTEAAVPLTDAVSSYLFNSQLVTLPDGTDALIAPIESRENERANSFLKSLPLRVHFVDVRQSMRNGGGPACLRLRVVLNDTELSSMQQGVILTEALHRSLVAWVEKHYRQTLSGDDLGDPKLLEESRRALDELTKLLDLGEIFAFQRE